MIFSDTGSTRPGTVGGRPQNVSMTLATARRLLGQALDAVRAAAGPAATDDELMAVLGVCESVVRQLDRVTVDTVAGLERHGAFAERGYRSATGALADLLGWERFEARRRVVAAERVAARVGLDGAALPARLPATADVFAAGRAGSAARRGDRPGAGLGGCTPVDTGARARRPVARSGQ
jgi:Domain of unknown function (DUF222)